MARSNTASTSNWLSSASVTGISSAPLSVACWFNPANLTHNANLVVVSNNSGSDYFALIFDGANANGFGDNVGLFEVSVSGTGDAVTATGGAAGTFMHLCGVTASSATRVCYLNGVAGAANVDTKTPSGLTHVDIGGLRIGASTFSPINGSVAEVAMWDAALTSEEVASLAKGFSPRLIRSANLQRYWRLIGRGTETCEVSGLALTVNGTMAQAAHARVLMPWASSAVYPSTAAGVVGQPYMIRGGGVPGMTYNGRGRW